MDFLLKNSLDLKKQNTQYFSESAYKAIMKKTQDKEELYLNNIFFNVSKRLKFVYI
jgi:hypothetical protein